MAITIIVTNAGRAALVNAANTGTNAVTITQMGITETAFAANAGQAALPGEIKRLASVAGVVVADDAIHVTASDVSPSAYTMRGFGFYLADGTLFALYGQAGPILNKTAESMMLLALDIGFADIDAAMIAFGDTNFILPPATTEILGLVELATTAEGQAGTDAARVLTPMTGKQSVLGWLLSQDGSGSGLDADLLDGQHASAFAAAGHTHGTMAEQNANAVNITGGAIDGVTLKSVLGNVGFGISNPENLLHLLGASPAIRMQPTASEQPISLLFGSSAATDGSITVQGSTGALTIAAGRNAAWGGNIRFMTDMTEKMRLTAAGRLVLGVAAENYLFNVGAGAASRGVVADFNTNGDVGAQISFTQAGISNNCFGTVPGTGDFGWYVNRNGVADGIELMRLTSNGRMGLGTGAPQAKLDVRGNLWVRAADAGYIELIGGASACTINASNTAACRFVVQDNELMRLASTGNFGVGTSGPSARLHVKSVGEIMRLETTAAPGGGNAFMSFYDPNGRKGYFGYGGVSDTIFLMNEKNGNLEFGTNTVSRWYMESAGHFTPVNDNAYDIGWSGGRIRNGFFGTSVSIAGNSAWHAGNDGSGSGLDADLLDGQHGNYYLPAASYTAGDVLAKLVGVDGAGSGLDADLLDGQQGAYYLPAAAYTAGDVLAKLIGVDGSGSGIDADLLDGYHGDDYLRVVAASVGLNGYVVFSNGLKILWGRIAVSQDSYSYVTYPITFDTVPTPVFPTIDLIIVGSQQNTNLASYNSYGFTIYQAADTSGTLPYHVIGK